MGALTRITLVLFFLILSGTAEAAKLTLFRWNLGYRAENVPAFKAELSEQELTDLRQGILPKDEKLFRGCYLAHVEFDLKRTLASEQPKSEVRKICISGNH